MTSGQSNLVLLARLIILTEVRKELTQNDVEVNFRETIKFYFVHTELLL